MVRWGDIPKLWGSISQRFVNLIYLIIIIGAIIVFDFPRTYINIVVWITLLYLVNELLLEIKHHIIINREPNSKDIDFNNKETINKYKLEMGEIKIGKYLQRKGINFILKRRIWVNKPFLKYLSPLFHLERIEPDFYLTDFRIFVEYYGVMDESKWEYVQEQKKLKKEAYIGETYGEYLKRNRVVDFEEYKRRNIRKEKLYDFNELLVVYLSEYQLYSKPIPSIDNFDYWFTKRLLIKLKQQRGIPLNKDEIEESLSKLGYSKFKKEEERG